MKFELGLAGPVSSGGERITVALICGQSANLKRFTTFLVCKRNPGGAARTPLPSPSESQLPKNFLGSCFPFPTTISHPPCEKLQGGIVFYRQIPLFSHVIPPVSLLLRGFASREQRYTSPLFCFSIAKTLDFARDLQHGRCQVASLVPLRQPTHHTLSP
ncbi:hypothetical protein N657DRAFT_437797 [Parathielavia appendiculata]|uniref:Uncharacterized protein n=1 Tax=Parathielavia appendiculata TaxID=2587402 RepID=A0AAN6U1B4_9PEZI|nr:hypothetical protein N657DRAFT_437797 [Parathielavia appendiculata]